MATTALDHQPENPQPMGFMKPQLHTNILF